VDLGGRDRASIISIGNLTVGGSGKTPVAREVLRLLRQAGVDAHALSRGYGGKLEGPMRVDLSRHSAEDVGDEPLMLAGDAPAWIARDRVAGARAAAAAGARALVLDDAHQNPALTKTLSLIVVDGETRNDEWPFGDGSVFPSGPMREPLKAGLARADAVVILLPADLHRPAGAAGSAPARTSGRLRRRGQTVEGRAVADRRRLRPQGLRPIP
jgi:tetraacyldisaccharide 4'-kinase